MSLKNSSSSRPLPFFTQLEARVKQVDSLLCVGLDPHFKELFPAEDNSQEAKSEEEKCDAAFSFCKTLIDATGMYLCIYLFIHSYILVYI